MEGPVIEGGTVLGLLGFFDELDDLPGRPNGSIREAVRPGGEPDEAGLVAYLDAGHVLIDVMEAGHDVIRDAPAGYRRVRPPLQRDHAPRRLGLDRPVASNCSRA